jgi:hypothetical protein
MKAEGHLGRCYLKGRAGDAVNVILSGMAFSRPTRRWTDLFEATPCSHVATPVSARSATLEHY